MTIVFPGTDGGAQWDGAATDPDGTIYIPARQNPCYSTLIPSEPPSAGKASARGANLTRNDYNNQRFGYRWGSRRTDLCRANKTEIPMKIVVTGSLGNISKPLATKLVQQGHTVTVISSKPDKQSAIEDLGATAAIGSLDDAGFLTATFFRADAVYCMIPPNFTVPDSRVYYQGIGRSYGQAIGQSGVKRIVHLSSWGAHLNGGTGFIAGSHDVEQLLNALPDVAITHLRAGSFYDNLYAYVDMIKKAGFIGTNYGGDDKIVMVSPLDIAAAVAEELTRPTGQDVRYVVSGEYTASEAARILGAAIGKPDLQWMTFTDEQTRSGLEQNGIPPHIATSFVELGASIHSGRLGEHYEQHKPSTMGEVKLDDFARDFATAYANR